MFQCLGWPVSTALNASGTRKAQNRNVSAKCTCFVSRFRRRLPHTLRRYFLDATLFGWLISKTGSTETQSTSRFLVKVFPRMFMVVLPSSHASENILRIRLLNHD
jgi:hypothetical protein